MPHLLKTCLLALALLLLPIGASAQPIEIRTLEELSAIRDNLQTDFGNLVQVKYLLMNDIDASPTSDPSSPFWNGGKGWEPIQGHVQAPDAVLYASLDGGGHVIRNLFINRPDESNVALFGLPGYLEIANLRLENVRVTGGGGTAGFIGGAVGYTGTTLTKCGVTGTITGGTYVGGLVGGGGEFSQCYSRAAVSGLAQVGGLSGFDCFASNSYATGSVTATDSVAGGIVGRGGHVQNCFSTAAVSAPTSAGGLAGVRDFFADQVRGSYWDTESSGQATTAPQTGGEPRTTAQMRTRSNFVGWDFTNVWTIDERAGYPVLQWEVSQFQIDTDALTWTGDNDGVAGSVNGVPFRALENAGVAEFYLAGDLVPNAGKNQIKVVARGSRPCRVTIGGDLVVPSSFDVAAEGQQPGAGGGRGGNGGVGGQGRDGATRGTPQRPAGGFGGVGANGAPGAAGIVVAGSGGFSGDPGQPGESGGDAAGAPGSGGVATVPGGGTGGGAGAAATIVGGGGTGGTYFFLGGTAGGNGGNGSEGGDAGPGNPGDDQIGAGGLRAAGSLVGGGGGAGAAGGGGGGGGAGGSASSGGGGGGAGSGITGRGGSGGEPVQTLGGSGGKGGNGASGAHGGGGGGAILVRVLGRASEVSMTAAGAAGVSTTGTGGADGGTGEPARGGNGPRSAPTETGGAGGFSGSVGRGGNGGAGGRGGNATGGGGAGGAAILEYASGEPPAGALAAPAGSPNGEVGTTSSTRILGTNPYVVPVSLSSPYIADLQGGPDVFGIWEGRTAADLPPSVRNAPPGAVAVLYRTATLFGVSEPEIDGVPLDWLVIANLSTEPILNPLFVAVGTTPLPLRRAGHLRLENGGTGIENIDSLPPGAVWVTLLRSSISEPIVISVSQGTRTLSETATLRREATVYLAPPIEIDTLAELDAIRDHLTSDYILTADIDASPTAEPGYNGGLGWKPIGDFPGLGAEPDPRKLFRGTLDGNGFAIHGLVCNRPAEPIVGLFTFLQFPGEIRNLTISNATLSGKNFAGALAGVVNDGTRVSGCKIEGGSVLGTLTVDCLLGGNLTMCQIALGGLAGAVVNGAEVTDCHSSASVTATGFTGGQSGSIPVWVGGLIGVNQAALIQSSSSSGTVTANVGNASAGGLVGGLYGEARNSFSTGNVISSKVAGGIAGTGSGDAVGCYATGDVTGGTTAGGVIGEAASAFACYFLGTLSSPGTVAGIAGGASGGAGYSYAAGRFAPGAATVFPLSAVAENSYWDFTASGLATSDPNGRTTTQMTFPHEAATTYVAAPWQPSAGFWQFGDATSLNNGYPYHPWQTARVTATYNAGRGGSVRIGSQPTASSIQLTRIPGASSAPVEAVPTGSNLFLRWSDGSTNNPRIDRNLTANTTVTAIFDVPPTEDAINRLLERTSVGFPDRNADGILDAGDMVP